MTPQDPCRDLTFKDVYDVIIDIERRIHAVRTLVGKLNPDIRLDLTERGIAEGWEPGTAKGLQMKVVCNVCNPVPKWPPFRE